MDLKREVEGEEVTVASSRRRFSRPVELLLYAATPLATLITAPILARALGPSARGEYGVVFAVVSFALTISAWGQAEAYLSEARSGHRGYRSQTKIALAFGLVAVPVTAAVLLALRIPLAAILVSVIWIPLLNQASLWRAVVVSHGWLRSAAVGPLWAAVIRAVSYVVLGVLGVLSLPISLLATQASSVVAALFTVGRSARRASTAEPSTSRAVRVLLRAGAAVIAFDFFNAISMRADVIVLQAVATPAEVGYYAAPAALTTAVLVLVGGFKASMQSEVVANGLSRNVFREARTVAVLAVLGGVVLFFVAPIAVSVLLGPDYDRSVVIMQLLAPATVGLIIFDLAQGLFVVLGRRRQLILVGASAAALNLVMLLILCPLAGAEGAAIASIVSYGLSSVLSWSYLWWSSRHALADRAS